MKRLSRAANSPTAGSTTGKFFMSRSIDTVDGKQGSTIWAL
jgi:hypothetical protein